MPRESAAAKRAREAEEELETNPVEFEEGDSLLVDLNEVEELSFETMPRGNYNVVCIENEFEYSASSGNPMWSVQWEVEDGDYAERKLFTHMVWAGKGLPFTKRQLARIFPSMLEGPINVKDQETIESLVGVRAIARVIIKKFEGEPRNNVRDLLAPSEGDDFT